MLDVSNLSIDERRKITKIGDVVTVCLFNHKTFVTTEKSVTVTDKGHKYFYDENHNSYYWDELKKIDRSIAVR